MVHTLGVIPARLASTRFPNKVLFPILSKPMIQHVWEACSKARTLNDCVIATDDASIKAVVESFGGRCTLTPNHFSSGTERVAWVARRSSAEIIVNVQGDEPLIDPVSIDMLIDHLQTNPNSEMATLSVRVSAARFGEDPNVVKVSIDDRGTAISFSRRLAAGYDRPHFQKHIGIYAFRRDALVRYCLLPVTSSEFTERLEQLRALENGMKIRVIEVDRDTIAVDTPSDIQRVEAYLKDA